MTATVVTYDGFEALKLEGAKKTLVVKCPNQVLENISMIKGSLDEHRKGKHASRPLTINMHLASRLSPFSYDSEMINLRGIVVILTLLLVSSSLEKVIQTFGRDGWILGLQVYEYFKRGGIRWMHLEPFLGGWIQMASIVISYALEKLRGKDGVSARVHLNLIYLNLTLLLILPVAFVWYFDTNPLFNVLYILNVCIVWLKLVSYHHVWNDVRFHLEKARAMSKKESLRVEDLPEEFGLTKSVAEQVLQYPENISFWRLIQFNILPTLCF